eukprot:CAMPEP_0202459310 /NCGR_PEP_ID=MMETSP1360-20130828/34591_1 /ASSEMBLY_ACC=CAM_ASM_000848 /TAXON_ID=515479 /ORGANISM="Licmophora paradoxa, Strain CCMP2313" /LENGTH=59 /DNA_ID=CAMNT_0049080319 /DNA_START=38 /DNA_END=214 /DNA_ORIENTATION=-
MCGSNEEECLPTVLQSSTASALQLWTTQSRDPFLKENDNVIVMKKTNIYERVVILLKEG